MPTIIKLQNQETFDFGLSIIQLNSALSDNVPYVYADHSDYAYLKLSTPEMHSIEFNFKNADVHYGTHQANILVSFYKYPSDCSERIGVIVLKFECPTFDISEVYEDYQSNFVYELGQHFLYEYDGEIS